MDKTADERAAARKAKARARAERRRAKAAAAAQKQKTKQKRRPKAEREASDRPERAPNATRRSWRRMLLAVGIIVAIAAFVLFVVIR